MNSHGRPMNCPSRKLFQNTDMRNDCCEKTWRDRSNEIIANYWLDCPPTCEINPGYLCEPGLNDQIPPLICDNISTDSDLKNGCAGNVITHTGAKQQLRVRPYRTVPHMGACRAPLMNPDTYSILLSGESTRTGKGCDSLSGVTIDRFEPLVPCIKYNIQDPVHYIPKYWVRGGMDTRSYQRNSDYLRSCGISNKNCITPCQKQFCPIQKLPPKMALARGQTANLPCMPNSCTINSRC
jgi:hypothetical protein